MINSDNLIKRGDPIVKLMLLWLFLLLSQHHVEPTYNPPEPIRYREVTVDAIVTYYTAKDDSGMTGDGITASGTMATEGRTIAMSQEYPFGTKVIIDGQEYTVEDRGGAIVGTKVDIFVNDKNYAMKQGVKHKKIKIVEVE